MDFSPRKIILGKFGKDVAWYVASLITLAVCGVALNILIAWVYGASVLGAFNQVYAVYILLSQLAVFGIHFSVLKNISQFRAEKALCSKIISSALVITLLLSVLIILVSFGLRGWIGDILQSPMVASGLKYALPGLLFFALNKVLLAVLNSTRQMKAYAVGLGLRYVLMLCFLIGLILFKASGNILPLLFTASECILFFWLLSYVGRIYPFVGFSKWSGWFKKHFLFGLRAFGGGALSEINTRVDVLMLGFFTGDSIVGIYSLAAILAEGLLQLTVAFRANVNPILSKLYFEKGANELKKIIKQGIKMCYPVMAGVGTLAIIAYPLLIRLFLGADNVFMLSWPVFFILTLGIMASAGYMPFSMLLNQTGFPGSQTTLRALVLLTNIILNLALIPILGMYGAAIATSFSFVVLMGFLKLFVNHQLKIKI
ncbi:MAG: oligosaccharide flippase family protein [Parcubacteria group bacterium]|nr:oligosaccharide flippase family protein [Parcubacteria group bacterium]